MMCKVGMNASCVKVFLIYVYKYPKVNNRVGWKNDSMFSKEEEMEVGGERQEGRGSP